MKLMDEDFIIAKSVFALVGALIIFGGILLANASFGSVWEIIKLIIGIAMVSGGICTAVTFLRGA
jgi:hypothetical protein